mmetsp:Transcript_18325/g.70791  ORF Transcript_18325/g.70791 Transcript_18325/m.70791 type:complete len:238 (-) Transcript_18325:187-900(-)
MRNSARRMAPSRDFMSRGSPSLSDVAWDLFSKSSCSAFLVAFWSFLSESTIFQTSQRPSMFCVTSSAVYSLNDSARMNRSGRFALYASNHWCALPATICRAFVAGSSTFGCASTSSCSSSSSAASSGSSLNSAAPLLPCMKAATSRTRVLVSFRSCRILELVEISPLVEGNWRRRRAKKSCWSVGGCLRQSASLRWNCSSLGKFMARNSSAAEMTSARSPPSAICMGFAVRTAPGRR